MIAHGLPLIVTWRAMMMFVLVAAAPETTTTLLQELHIDLVLIVAGLSGGTVNAIVFGRQNFQSMTGSMIVGALVANYMASAAAKLLGWEMVTSAFLLGVVGVAVIQGLYTAAKQWRPNVPGTSGPPQDGGK